MISEPLITACFTVTYIGTTVHQDQLSISKGRSFQMPVENISSADCRIVLMIMAHRVHPELFNIDFNTNDPNNDWEKALTLLIALSKKAISRTGRRRRALKLQSIVLGTMVRYRRLLWELTYIRSGHAPQFNPPGYERQLYTVFLYYKWFRGE